MALGGLTFLNPLVLAGLITLPLLWWLLRAVPPAPTTVVFPATRLLRGLTDQERTAARTPWWLTLLRLLAAAVLIGALADPILRPLATGTTGRGPLVVVIDTGWGAGQRWDDLRETALGLVEEAQTANRTVLVVETARRSDETLGFTAPAAARQKVRSLEPMPHPAVRMEVLDQVRSAVTADSATQRDLSIAWLSDGIDYGDADAFLDGLTGLVASADRVTVIGASQAPDVLGVRLLDGTTAGGAAAAGRQNSQSPSAVSAPALTAEVIAASDDGASGSVVAFDDKGRALRSVPFTIPSGETSARIALDLPLELVNQIANLAIAGQRTAAAVHLFDEGNRRRRVAMISGEGQEKDQPLLGSLYYARRALTPFVALELPRGEDIASAVDAVAREDVTTIVLADVGTLNTLNRDRLSGWVGQGGVLIRFSGPRMERARDSLLPAPLRFGGRRLGGALSWERPRPIQDFEEDGLFAGLPVPADVTVSRQVLADPARLRGDTRIWARLDDGTPLVTARQIGKGWVVLFHVTANTDWSNLPLSGVFVDMLRRLVALSGATISEAAASAAQMNAADARAANEADALATASGVLAPVRVLDGFGVLGQPPVSAKPIARSLLERSGQGPQAQVTASHPPGYYGSARSQRALNLVTASTALTAIGTLPIGVTAADFIRSEQVILKPWLLLACLGLLALDVLAIMLLQGFGRRQAGSAGSRNATATGSAATVRSWLLAALTAGGIAFVGLSATTVAMTAGAGDAAAQGSDAGTAAASSPPSAQALSDDDIARLALQGEAALVTRFAYVLTGNGDVDERSRSGLSGLARVLASRTAIEPGEPYGVDIAGDDLTFFPILYWPVLQDADPLDDAQAARIDAYMKNGGMVIFDTRDAGQSFSPDAAWNGRGARALQRLLARLNLPRLTPVRSGHVLTKSFYLLDRFPGRWDASPLWVEALDEGTDAAERARQSDGVSAILVTANDLASAWAMDGTGRPLFPVVPGGAVQREMAFRTGVNIVMYALTGNYKADQVHVPALLERLGQ